MCLFRAFMALFLLIPPASAQVRGDTAELVLANRNLRAVFSSRGLASLLDVRTGSKVTFKDESFALTVNGRAISQAAIGSGDLKVEKERLTFGLRAGQFAVVFARREPRCLGLGKPALLRPGPEDPQGRVDSVPGRGPGRHPGHDRVWPVPGPEVPGLCISVAAVSSES